MEWDAIDDVARDATKQIAMRVGNLERRMLVHRDLMAALLLLIGMLAAVLMLLILLRW